MAKYNLQQLVDYLSEHVEIDLQLKGNNPELEITNVATLVNSSNNSLSFFTNPKYKDDLNITKAGVILTSQKYSDLVSSACIVTSNPHLAYAKIAKLFDCKNNIVNIKNISNKNNIHSTVIVGNNSNIANTAVIGPNVVIGDNCTIEDGANLKAGVVIGDNCNIGNNSLIYPKVVLYNKVSIGNNCIIHSGTVIGCDGLGFALTDEKEKSWYKVPQLGGVVIGNNVEIGANTTIDCGAIEDTIIKDGVKLDNQIHIAHNVVIDKHTIMAAQVGIAGSSKIGKYCAFGGGSAISGHLTVADGVKLAGFTTVGKSILKPGFYASGTGPAIPYTKWRRLTVYFEGLDKYITKLKKL